MQHQQDSWDDIMQNWHSKDDQLQQQLPTPDTLIAQINKRNRNNKIEVIMALVAGVLAGGYIVWEMYLGLPSIADKILYSIFLALIVLGVANSYVSLSRSIVASADRTKDHVTVLLNQSEYKVKELRIGQIIMTIMCLVILFIVGVIAYIGLFERPLEYKHYLVAGICSACSILFIGNYIWFKRQIKQFKRQIHFLSVQ